MDTTKIVETLKFGNVILPLAGGSGGVEFDPTVPQYVKDITEQDIQSWDNKAEKSEIPDVSQFITNTVDNLVNYYTKTETDNKLSAIPKFDINPVEALPTENISSTTIYLLKVGADSPELYEEYIYVNGAWELLGTAKVDLTGYVKDTDYATETKAGVVTLYHTGTYGVGWNEVSGLFVAGATDTMISSKVTANRPITPSKLDYAVKVGLTTNTIELTEEEKASVQKWLGIDTLVGNINTELENVLGV